MQPDEITIGLIQATLACLHLLKSRDATSANVQMWITELLADDFLVEQWTKQADELEKLAIEPAKIYTQDGVFNSQDDMNRYYAARATDLFGNHALMTNQDDHDGY